MERILDIIIRLLYRRVYYQINATSISDRLQRYVDKMTSIITLPSDPRAGTKPVPFYHQILTRHCVPVHRESRSKLPYYDTHRRQTWSIKRCIGHKCVGVYGAGCRLVALKSWYLYFHWSDGDHVWFGDGEWNATESPRFFHSSRPIGHGLASILVSECYFCTW